MPNYSKFPKITLLFGIIQIYSKIFQIIPKYSKLFQNIRNYSKILFVNIPDCSLT